ncbi:MAG: hypothetical protein WAX07_01180 [Candidatus Altiarchaeia archaeon]
MKTALSEWTGIGAAIGIIYGLLLENIGLGVALGICIGTAAGYYKTTRTYALVVGILALSIAIIGSSLDGGLKAVMGAAVFIIMGLAISYSARGKGDEK